LPKFVEVIFFAAEATVASRLVQCHSRSHAPAWECNQIWILWITA